MADFKKRPSSSGFRKNSFGGRGAQTELFTAECSSCHKQCQVPFRPSGAKPVYCSDCFNKNDDRGQASRGRDSRNFEGGRRPEQSRPMAPGIEVRQIEQLTKEVVTLRTTIERLVLAIESQNRASSLTLEVRKHMPAQETEKKRVAPKKTVAKKPVAAPKKKTTKK